MLVIFEFTLDVFSMFMLEINSLDPFQLADHHIRRSAISLWVLCATYWAENGPSFSGEMPLFSSHRMSLVQKLPVLILVRSCLLLMEGN